MPILITSTGLSFPKAQKKFSEVLKDVSKNNALLITTAAENKSKNKYSILAKKQLLSYGVNKVKYFDLEKNKNINLSDFGIVYVCGGNTFKLMKYVNNTNFTTSIKKFLEKDGLYIGVSAGSIILGPNIEIAGCGKNGDKNIVNLKNLSGMNILPYSVSPHFKTSEKIELEKFDKKVKYKVKTLTDEDIIYIKNKPQ
jgi:dipeptidase E